MCRIGLNAEMVKKLLRRKIVVSLTPLLHFFTCELVFENIYFFFCMSVDVFLFRVCVFVCNSACHSAVLRSEKAWYLYAFCVCARGRVVFKHGTCTLSVGVGVCEGELFFAPALVSR